MVEGLAQLHKKYLSQKVNYIKPSVAAMIVVSCLPFATISFLVLFINYRVLLEFPVASKYDCLDRALIYKHICLGFHPSYGELFY